jgi:uncharacterized protein YndB with AHSA1/START domain
MTDDVRLDGDELIATRYVDADVPLVWECFTTPEHLAAFWGGNHATVPPESVRVDLHVGGMFCLETRGADGAGRRLEFRYDVIDPPTRLVLTQPDAGITTEIRLQPTGDGTQIVVRQRHLPPELRSERARVGLVGILEQLEHLLHAFTGNQGDG